MSKRQVVCIVEDHSAHSALHDILSRAGWRLRIVGTLTAALRATSAEHFDVGLLLPGAAASAAEWEWFLRQRRDIEWIGVFRPDALESPAWHSLILDHLFDHHTLPIDSERLLGTLGHALGRAALHRSPEDDEVPSAQSGILGRSPAIRVLLRQIKRLAPVCAPVLIGGESGTGKELAAQAIQRGSARAQAPFVSINCSAIPAALVQSELFGHVRGAFTGADRDKTGIFEAANHGTVFLDEIGDLSMDVQVSLLRFLQDKVVMRLGSTSRLQLDVRVIAATHVDLERAMAAGRFRHDLYYRLKVLSLTVPPLRERRSDIELLARHFFGQFAHEANACLKGFSPAALSAMAAHDWPGNVRELVNRVRSAVVMADGRYITPADLDLPEPGKSLTDGIGLADVRLDAERRAVHSSLDLARRNVSQAARWLGVSRMTMYRLMAKHGAQV
jgi:DNA-binding NtrC family response regulator